MRPCVSFDRFLAKWQSRSAAVAFGAGLPSFSSVSTLSCAGSAC